MTRRSPGWRLGAGWWLAGLAACGGATSDPQPVTVGPAAAEPLVTVSNDERFHADIRHAIAAHERWGRVDDRARFTPFDCRAPLPPSPRFSESADTATHGGKLYTVFAMVPEAYGFPAHVFDPGMAGPSETSCPGCDAHHALAEAGVRQVLFKDAFEAVQEAPADDQAHGLWPTSRDGVTYHAGRSLGFFLLLQYDASTPGTDAGFIYATGQNTRGITSSGLVGPCMSCHQEQATRVFGIPGHPVPAPGPTGGP
ncbi:MAG: hypothetical protein IPG81_12960 [Sandaracinaceae bacterium]|nr:hypothetical protein [Sandaracinaceae bacterium]